MPWHFMMSVAFFVYGSYCTSRSIVHICFINVHLTLQTTSERVRCSALIWFQNTETYHCTLILVQIAVMLMLFA